MNETQVCRQCGWTFDQSTPEDRRSLHGDATEPGLLCSRCYDAQVMELPCEACDVKIVGREGDRPHPRALLDKHVREAHEHLRQLCPRRGENPVSNQMFPGGDAWVGGRCSYCGSVSPDRFFAIIERGDEVVPSDKNYKAHLRTADRDEIKFYFQHLSIEQRKQFVDLINAKKINIGYPGYFYTLPFFCERVT